MTWPHGDPNAVIGRVLADPAYASARPTTSAKPHTSLLEILWDWFHDHVWSRLFHPLAHAIVSSRGVATFAGYVLVGLALAGLAFVVFRLIVAFVRVPSEARARGGDALPLAADRSARDWRAFARAAAARGEFARAIAALFAAALAELDERGLVSFDASRTPGEYRRLVRRASAAAEVPFDDLTDRFVRAVYAPGAPASGDYDAAERALAALEPALSA